jgi:hypothetical protein
VVLWAVDASGFVVDSVASMSGDEASDTRVNARSARSAARAIVTIGRRLDSSSRRASVDQIILVINSWCNVGASRPGWASWMCDVGAHSGHALLHEFANRPAIKRLRKKSQIVSFALYTDRDTHYPSIKNRGRVTLVGERSGEVGDGQSVSIGLWFYLLDGLRALELTSRRERPNDVLDSSMRTVPAETFCSLAPRVWLLTRVG